METFSLLGVDLKYFQTTYLDFGVQPLQVGSGRGRGGVAGDVRVVKLLGNLVEHALNRLRAETVK